MESYTFNGQRKGERVYEVVKNHPYVLMQPGLRAVFITIAGLAIFLFWTNQVSGVILFIAIAIAFGVFFRKFYNYSQSVFVISNLRVINVEQEGFLKRTITETDLDKIQDISSSTKGLARMMLKYGDLMIRTAGASQGTEIVVKDIANPYNVQQKVTLLRSKREGETELNE